MADPIVAAVRAGVEIGREILAEKGIRLTLRVQVHGGWGGAGEAGAYRRLSQFTPGGALIDLYAPTIAAAKPMSQFIDLEATHTLLHEVGHVVAEHASVAQHQLIKHSAKLLREIESFEDEEIFAEEFAQQLAGVGRAAFRGQISKVIDLYLAMRATGT